MSTPQQIEELIRSGQWTYEDAMKAANALPDSSFEEEGKAPESVQVT